MNISVSAWDLVNDSAFAKHFTSEGLDAIADYLEESIGREIVPACVIDETLLNATEQPIEDALEENECKSYDELFDKMEEEGHYSYLLDNDNVLIIQ